MLDKHSVGRMVCEQNSTPPG